MLILIINACAVNAKSKKSPKPKWLTNPKKVYPEQLYLTAIGEGDTRSDAENMAAANLSKIFEATIPKTPICHFLSDRTITFLLCLEILFP